MACGDTSLRPFQFHASDEALADLRRRIAATKWPNKELVSDASQGVQLATMQKLANYWANQYDWRKVEARLDALPQFVTNIDGVDIHFHPRPLEAPQCIATDHHTRLAGLDHGGAEDHRSAHEPDGPWRKRIRCVRRRDPVTPRLWIFGEAYRARVGPGPHRTRVDRADEAPRIHAIRGARRRLG